ncbi:MAG TPA: enolase C-terminal domain-like protein [Steroidobacter sp.]|uniref:enolase C-terminal domain-like protein n=1 Tax=Steroidobacter sp. TaxID=1978227 RepID=UPI002ED819D2
MKIVGCRISELPEHSRFALELLSDEQLTGVSIVPAVLAPAVQQLTNEALVDTDARATLAAWERLSRINQARSGALGEAIAALDIALWDLKAKRDDQPLWRALGGLQPRANVHVRAPDDDGSTSLQEWCVQLASSGIRGVLLSSSGSPARDASRLATIRDSLGRQPSDLDLMLDVRGPWSPKETIRAVRRIEWTIDLAWVEGATHDTDFLGLERISTSIRAGVCAGGQLRSAADFLPHLHHRSLDYVQIDTSRVGISEALRIADAAYAFELPVILAASPGNLNVHLAAALPYCASVEVGSELLQDTRFEPAANSDVRIECGRAVTGTRPGHGIVIDPATAPSTSATPA